MYPRQSPTTHTEQLGDEASVYDWARGQVHALNPTAARVWRQCDGATSRDAIAAVLRGEMGIPEAEAVVDLTLTQLARVHLLELPVESRVDRSTPTRRWLLGRGLTAALLPAIYSIVAPSSVDAQSLPAAAPTLTSLSPNQGSLGTTVAVTLTGTNFVVGATTVTVNSGGVSAANVIVSSATSLTVDIVITATATTGAHTVTVTTAGGTSGAQTFTVSAAPPPAPTLTSVAPNQGVLSSTVPVTLTGTNFVVGATTVAVSGSGVTVSNIVVGSATSLTADFVIAAAAATGARTVTVTTAGGTSGGQTFTVNAPAPGAPTLTSVAPPQGIRGTTVAVTLTGTNFVVGATTVAVSGTGVTVNTVVVGSSTSLTASFVLDPAAATGPRTVTVTTAGGTSGGQTFTINLPPPTLTIISPNQGTKGIGATTVPVTMTGTNFVVGATTVTVSGAGVAVNNVVVGSTTSLTANLVLDPAAATGARTVTVTTAGGTTAALTFTVNPGSMPFAFTGAMQTFAVPPGVTTLTVTAEGAQGGAGGGGASPGGMGGRVTATLTGVVPGEMLNVFVGGQGGTGASAAGGFNGGADGGAGNFAGGGGGASDIRRLGSALSNRVVVAGGGGGGAFNLGGGGAGGGLTGGAGANSQITGVNGGAGGTQSAGGLGGVSLAPPTSDGQPGASGIGGKGGLGSAGAAGGGGGGGYFGGGGGAGGSAGNLPSAGGGGGSSLDATGVGHTQGTRAGDGEVTIGW